MQTILAQSIISYVFWISLAAWMVSEAIIRFHDRKLVVKGAKQQDKGSKGVIVILAIVAIVLSILSVYHVPSLNFQNLGIFTLGIALIWLGIPIRWWAINTLGRFFNTNVVIQKGHKVITNGPYKYVRNPSYTAIMISILGIGLALGNILGLIILIALPLIGIINRIRVEEQALISNLGNDYRSYMKNVKWRLIPLIW
jgi:protein-S-isoprenylcysteine O-methyltransferase Ste14